MDNKKQPAPKIHFETSMETLASSRCHNLWTHIPFAGGESWTMTAWKNNQMQGDKILFRYSSGSDTIQVRLTFCKFLPKDAK
jgi:hypothetical protein